MKHILFLMADQLRADHLGWHAHTRMETPHFDRLAEGMTFSRCLTSNPVCTPARCSLLTGRYTRQISMLRMSGDLNREFPTYPQALQKAGYKTAGIGKFHWLQTWPWATPVGQGLDLVALHRELKAFGFDHVWECSGKQLAVKNFCDYAKYLDDKGLLEAYRAHVLSRGENCNFAPGVNFTGEPWPFDEADYPDIVTTDRILDWLETETGSGQPFFLFGSLVSPHQPLDPPQSYLDRVPYEEIDDFVCGEDEEPLDDKTKRHMWKLRHAYRAMVRLVDDQIGRIFAKLEEKGILDETIIVFVADHGEMLGDHGRFQKSIHWHQSAVVPCAIRHPDFLAGASFNKPVELVDITATLLDMAGCDPVASLSRDWPAYQNIIPGKSLVPILEGHTDSHRESAFCEYDTQWTMLHSEQYAYVRMPTANPDAPRELLFDLEEDPDECRNVASDPAMAEVLAWHRNRLLHRIETHPPAQTRWAPLP